MWEELQTITLPLRTAAEIAAFARQAPHLDRHADTSLHDVLRATIRDPSLSAVLTGFAGIHAVPSARCSAILHLTTLVHYLQGAFYPRGGGQVLADALVDRIREDGGEVVLAHAVERIVVHRGRATAVHLEGGESIDATAVISNADLKRTMLELVGAEQLPVRYAGRIEGFRMSLPLFSVFGSTTLDLHALGLGNFNVHVIDDVEGQGIDACERGEMPSAHNLFFTSSSLKDPERTHYAPPGELSFQLITLAPMGSAAWGAQTVADHRSAAYRETKQRMLERVLEQTERRLVPGLRAHLGWIEAATPLTQERFTRSSGGASYGIESSARQFGMYRPHYRTPIENLLLCGASTVSGHGIIGAMVSGLGAAGELLGEGLMARVLQSGAPRRLAFGSIA